MPPPGKPLTPAEISALEHAFASDPTSDAYRPLTEAYLSASRFMEAMVVCKKGVKAHPDDPAAKVLLARVYAEQGKDRKALAIEPMTCPPNAIVTADDLLVLEPGQAVTHTWGIQVLSR